MRNFPKFARSHWLLERAPSLLLISGCTQCTPPVFSFSHPVGPWVLTVRVPLPTDGMKMGGSRKPGVNGGGPREGGRYG